MVEIFSWFRKSGKHKEKLKEYFEFCNQECKAVLKHLSIRWLSLEKKFILSYLKTHQPESFFQSENFPNERFKGLDENIQKNFVEASCGFPKFCITLSTCSCNKKRLQFIALARLWKVLALKQILDEIGALTKTPQRLF